MWLKHPTTMGSSQLVAELESFPHVVHSDMNEMGKKDEDDFSVFVVTEV